MSNFWPSGIELSDTQSPKEILKNAQEDWRTSSDGVMELVLQDALSESGNPMIIVYAKHVVYNRTATLLSVVHQPEKPYPVTIQPTDESLPNFLKKSYHERSLSDGVLGSSRLSLSETMLEAISGKQPKSIENRWVSDTPSEFRVKLAEAFNLGITKRSILNLASNNTDNMSHIDEESSEDSDEEVLEKAIEN
jgi:hypothetical protein